MATETGSPPSRGRQVARVICIIQQKMDYKIKIKNINESCDILRLNDDAQGFVTSLIIQNFTNNDIVFIAKNDVEMEIIQKQIEFFAPHLADKFEILNFFA